MTLFDSFRKFKFFGIPEVMYRISNEENEWKHYQILELQRHSKRYEYLPLRLAIGTSYIHRFQPLEYEECETTIEQCIYNPHQWLNKIKDKYNSNYMYYCKMSKNYCIVVYEYPTPEDPFCNF